MRSELTLFSKYRSSDTTAAPRRVLSWDNTMHGTTVIPHGNGTHRPLPTDKVVISGVYVEVGEIQQFIFKPMNKLVNSSFNASPVSKGRTCRTALCLLQLREPCHEPFVYIECLEPGHGMCADCWMMRIDWRTVGADSPQVEYSIIWFPRSTELHMYRNSERKK